MLRDDGNYEIYCIQTQRFDSLRPRCRSRMQEAGRRCRFAAATILLLREMEWKPRAADN
jgi:hypothetical protein